MTGVASIDLELIARLEAHSVSAWPAVVCERDADGWTFRATPGLARGRSNHALPPCRELAPDEIDAGIERAAVFARRHGIEPGVQISPLEVHGPLDERLRELDWRRQEPVLVMAAPSLEISASGPGLELVDCDHADAAWLEAWSICEPGRDVPSHAGTVFPLLSGIARFARVGCEAVGIVVESDGLAGLFCLAVAPAQRRRGLGSALVRGLLAGCRAQSTAYLQVEGRNRAAIGMYDRLGFEIAYRYRHAGAPA